MMIPNVAKSNLKFVATLLLLLILLFNHLMASSSFSRSLLRSRPPCLSFSRNSPKHLRFKSYPCPLWSSSFSFCLPSTRHRITSLSLSSLSPMATATAAVDHTNPLLVDFEFPPFDSVKPQHVRPGIRSLLNQLEKELNDLEKNVEPKWEKLVDPLEKIFDKLSVAWGMVNHLKSVKDCPELRSAIEEVQVRLLFNSFDLALTLLDQINIIVHEELLQSFLSIDLCVCARARVLSVCFYALFRLKEMEVKEGEGNGGDGI